VAGFLPVSGQTQRMRFHSWVPAATVLFTAFSHGLRSCAATDCRYSDASPAG
jgi:hypothetical protein